MSNTQITCKRKLNGQFELIDNGKPIGLAWRWPMGTGRNGRRRSGYGVRIDGFYWRQGKANQRCGITTTCAKTLRDACEIAQRVLLTKGEAQ